MAVLLKPVTGITPPEISPLNREFHLKSGNVLIWESTLNCESFLNSNDSKPQESHLNCYFIAEKNYWYLPQNKMLSIWKWQIVYQPSFIQAWPQQQKNMALPSTFNNFAVTSPGTFPSCMYSCAERPQIRHLFRMLFSVKHLPKTSPIEIKVAYFSQCSIISSLSVIHRPHFVSISLKCKYKHWILKYFILFSSSIISSVYVPFAASCLGIFSSLAEQEMFPFKVSGYINI